jgi:hypothetical protein
MGKSKMYASSEIAARPEFTGPEYKLQQKKHYTGARRFAGHPNGAKIRIFSGTCTINLHSESMPGSLTGRDNPTIFETIHAVPGQVIS